METTAKPAVQFQLQNAQGQSVLYVTQDTSQNVLTFTITYSGTAAVTVKGGAPVSEDKITPAGPTSFYFTVSSVLSPKEFATMRVTPPAGWQAALFGSWALTPIADTKLEPGQSLVFTLTKITANGRPGPGSFNIDYYNISTVANSGTQLPLSLQNLPNLHKRLADSMFISMVGGNSVYIDVNDQHLIPPNTLVLQLNNSTGGPLVPPGAKQGKPVFYLTFVSASGAPGYGALTTIDRLKNIVVGTNGDYGTVWDVQDHRQNDPPYWAIYPKSPEILGTGASAIAEFRISNIVTDFDPSSTNLYLQSVDIPTYDDGSMTQPLVKAVPTLALQGVGPLKDNVPSGTQVGLTWTSFNANRCTVSPVDGGEVPAPAQPDKTGFPVTVARTTTFTVTAYNDALGTKTSGPATVNVLPVTVSEALTAVPATGYHFGDRVSLSWAFSSAQSCTVDPPINGSASVPAQSDGTAIFPTAAQRYTITAQGQAGPAATSLDIIPIPNGWKSVPGAGPWDTRGRPVLLAEFLDQIWFLAGGADDLKSIVFSSRDGFTWSIVNNAAAFSPRTSAAGCVFAGKLWLTGGATLNGGVLDEIWSSSDGVTWTKVAATQHWPARADHGCVAFAGKIWVMGGRNASGTLMNDIWSSTDGVSWTCVKPSAVWSARSAFGLVNFGNGMCVIAGSGAGGVLADVWQSGDGATWNGLSNTVPWPARSSPGVAVLGEQLYVVGGMSQAGLAFSDSNIADQSGNWSMGLGPNWGATVLDLGTTAFRDAMWFAGGSANGLPNTTVWGFGT
ncbi:hypothetical protein ACVIHI_009067 [Bradyrhizobium sp. USDA 4524]|uniref:Kelch repeat-containing protein n=1 Tax=unclassified Bradyrhizobium TaxID=2631580 RepID=UPI00209CD539|nr:MULTISPECIES: kelch repeat-containing protein [unclassified Bradyrhizobium]MCP1846153.1 hypothetical protein [Bradyrhizobium sp. USDA 4538]MCP1907212.1 hypothetical protein [Bradyrhizobium sp. USDA 4537]MCP1985688.1 hypothetical protein [Bradyrhizobium sp. USDA 4539]